MLYSNFVWKERRQEGAGGSAQEIVHNLKDRKVPAVQPKK
jgi:hypothetical protein